MSLAVSELAKRFQLESIHGDAAVTGVQLASNLCEPGDLFIAIGGARQHGIQYLEDAINRGAVAVLTDPEHIPATSIPVLTHADPKSVAGAIAAMLYGTQGQNFRIFGVTGTNGKTSTATYIQQILEAAGQKCGLSASTNRIVGDQVLSSSLTTPEVTEVHRMIQQMRNAGQEFAALEVSAQALVRHRVDEVKFDVVGFTNLSRDHLDDFGDMGSYLEVKARLFTPEYAVRGVVLVEDEYAAKLVEKAQIPVATISKSGDYWYHYENGLLTLSGKKSGVFEFAGGALMAKNLVLAIVILLEAGFPIEKLKAAVQTASLSVPGRLERVSQGLPAVFIDYAHTPAGVAAAVGEIKARYPHLSVVLGASGNRDQGKREAMAEAGAGGDLLVITDQHPRDEDPALIRKTLIESASKLLPLEQLVEIADPALAIAHAISATPKDGAVLWCGPGHLTYREVAGTKLPFDARKVAAELVSND